MNVSSLDEAISEVENNIDNTMSNVGCDPFSPSLRKTVETISLISAFFMVYKIENQRIILNNGELFKVTGVASSLSNERNILICIIYNKPFC